MPSLIYVADLTTIALPKHVNSYQRFRQDAAVCDSAIKVPELNKSSNHGVIPYRLLEPNPQKVPNQSKRLYETLKKVQHQSQH